MYFFLLVVCICQAGYLRSGTKCVPEALCMCYDDIAKTPRKAGERWNRGCEECRCVDNKVTCTRNCAKPACGEVSLLLVQFETIRGSLLQTVVMMVNWYHRASWLSPLLANAAQSVSSSLLCLILNWLPSHLQQPLSLSQLLPLVG